MDVSVVLFAIEECAIGAHGSERGVRLCAESVFEGRHRNRKWGACGFEAQMLQLFQHFSSLAHFDR